MNKREIGKEKEELACNFLKKKGYVILAVNYWCRYSEIDIVARDGDNLVFVEVKYRKSSKYGSGSDAVSEKKMRNIIRCARYYIYKERVDPDSPMRFDVIAIDGEKIRHIVNAFEAVD